MFDEREKPKVSVIIPSYNHALFIGQAIQSVIDQTYTNFEIIIADDASPDHSVEVIDSIQDKRIQFHKFEKNMGAAYTTNFCIKQATGQYIALLNSDDMWELNKLELQVKILDENQHIGAVFSDVAFVNEEGKVLNKTDFSWATVFSQENRSQGEWLKRFFYEQNCLCHPSILIRKELYEKTKLYNMCLRQLPDFAMWVKVLKLTSIHVMKEKLVRFKILTSSENTSADSVVNRTRNMNETLLIMRDFFSEMPAHIFIDGFKEFLIHKGDLSEDMISCEQAFLFLKVDSELATAYKVIAIEKIYELLQKENTQKVLAEIYNFTENDFFKLTGNMQIPELLTSNLKNIMIVSIKKRIVKHPQLYKFAKKIYFHIRK